MNYSGVRLTNAGLNLLARSLSGEKIIFTRGGFGDAILNEEMQTPTLEEQAALTSLINQKMSLPITNITVEGDTASIDLEVDNSAVEEEFKISEIGLFAQDGNNEVLYSYFYAGNDGDVMPKKQSSIIKDFTYTLVAQISNAALVTAIIQKNFTLPVATTDSLGGIIVGNGLSIDGAGKLDVTLSGGGGSGNPFSEKVTMNGGFEVADSVSSDLGDYGLLKAANKTIQITDSTIKANTSTGNYYFASRPVFEGKVTFNDGLTVADSVLGNDLGEHGSIKATNDTINVSNSTITATAASIGAAKSYLSLNQATVAIGSASIGGSNWTIGGSIHIDGTTDFEGNDVTLKDSNINMNNATLTGGNANYHFDGKPHFDSKPTLAAGIYIADSLNNDLGDYGSIKATNDTLNVTNSTIIGAHTVTGDVTFTGNVSGLPVASTDSLGIVKAGNGLSIDGAGKLDVTLTGGGGNGNPFSEKVTMNGGFEVAASLKNDLGRYGSIKAMNDTINVMYSTIDAKNSSIYAGGSTIITASSSINGAYSTVQANSSQLVVTASTLYGSNTKNSLQGATVYAPNSYVTLSGASITATDASINAQSSDITLTFADLTGDQVDFNFTNTNFEIDNPIYSTKKVSVKRANVYFGSCAISLSTCDIDATASSITGTPFFTENLCLSTVPCTLDGGIWYAT